MVDTELHELEALLSKDDFAKDIALGIALERAADMNRLRALHPWQDERYSNSDIGNGYPKPRTWPVSGSALLSRPAARRGAGPTMG